MNLESSCDAVVMLTWSNWFEELRSNRYHYATRFAKILPVIFVQPDLKNIKYYFEESGIPNLIVLHVYSQYNDIQVELINKALLERNCIKPIFWVYNSYFADFLARRYSILNVYHATEDYLASDSPNKFRNEKKINTFVQAVNKCQLLISVSEGVESGFRSKMNYLGEMGVITNGCDYNFYRPSLNNMQQSGSRPKIVFYQGNIFNKLDFNLLVNLATRLKDWTFNFCGKVIFNESEWVSLCKLPNVKYLGLLSPEGVRNESYKATVGIIPFEQVEWLTAVSFPLKAFEYLAAGLPVVSTPIKSLLPYSEVILFADNVDDFVNAIQVAEKLRNDKSHTIQRLKVAAQQDYNIKFKTAKTMIEQTIAKQQSTENQLKVLVLHDLNSVFDNKTYHLLSCFSEFSKHRIFYLPINPYLNKINLNYFDVVFIKIKNSLHGKNLYSLLIKALRTFGGYKIICFEEGDNHEEKVAMLISKLGIHKAFRLIPADKLHFRETDCRSFVNEFDLHLSKAMIIKASKDHLPQPVVKSHNITVENGIKSFITYIKEEESKNYDEIIKSRSKIFRNHCFVIYSSLKQIVPNPVKIFIKKWLFKFN